MLCLGLVLQQIVAQYWSLEGNSVTLSTAFVFFRIPTHSHDMKTVGSYCYTNCITQATKNLISCESGRS